MIVRQLGADDWQTARTARLAALAGSPPGTFASSLEETKAWDEQLWRQWSGKRVMFVAESEAGVIGCAGGVQEGGVPVLVSMFVAPDARGTGTSDRLIEAVTEWARTGGYPELRLWVLDGNVPAEKLYRRLGFLPTGQTRAVGARTPHVEYEMSRPLR
jgi:GNAT superfamily N-acetyltransferase